MSAAQAHDVLDENRLSDLEAGGTVQTAGPRLELSYVEVVVGDAGLVTTADDSFEGADGEEAPAASQVADVAPPSPIRSAFNCIFGLLLVAVALCVGVACLPILCCCLLGMYCTQGRTVFLDGTKPPNPDEETTERIASLKADSFVPRLEDFRSSFNRTVTRARTISGDTTDSFTSTSTGKSKSTVGTVCNGNSPTHSKTVNKVGLKRQSLTEARIAACRQSSQSIPGTLIIAVEREHALKQSLACLGAAHGIDLLAKTLHIDFVGERGLDAGGIARDWFDSLGHSLVADAERSDGHLMVLPDRTLAPRPYDTRFSDLYAIGRLIGLALWFGIPLPIPLGSVTCKFMLDFPISPVDLQRLDPEFVQFRVKPVLRPLGVCDLEAALGEPLTFVSAATELRPSKELCPGGEERRVTEENKQEYLKLLCEHHLCGDMKEQVKVLLEGFWDIFPKDMLTCAGITHRELALLISGYPSLDPDEWRSNTRLNSSACDELMTWFWDVVKDMSAEDRAKLLHFATGSSRLPASGFAGMSPRFNISIQGDETEHLPHAHTCGNQLVIPRYSSKEQLVEKLQIALSNDEGFGFM